jgi:replicative superfamily II helicase
MPPIVAVGDQNELVATTNYPFAKFPFEKFNPVQSRIFEFYDQETSAVIAAATSAGKTVCAEMFLAHEIRKRGGKGMYLAPLRALAQEKIDDWTSKEHHLGDRNLSICTGDYRLTPERHAELEKADLILMTSEMLNSRCRNFKVEKNGWLKDIGTLIVDESHLLTVPGRGDHLEAGLMKFTHLNDKCRLVFLSATMPNVTQISEWVAYSLTGKDTRLLVSEYRPCPLNVHYEKYYDGEGTYERNELQKIETAAQIVDYYPEDKFLIFVHTKRTGELMKQALQRYKVQCEYHNADLEKGKRIKLEKQFKEDPNLRVVVATSTLAWGLNLPARRVIVLGVHRGLSEVATYDVFQMVGRAGRPAYDPVGDAYILVPERDAQKHKDRLRTPQPIKSQMLNEVSGRYKTLAFHLVSEIHQGNVKTSEDVFAWFRRSLASFQAQEMDQQIVDNVIDLLRKCGAIWQEENGTYSVTSVGKVASMFYYSPFDVSELRRNFDFLFQEGKENDDHELAMALGNVDTLKFGICNRLEKEEMGRFQKEVELANPLAQYTDAAMKAGYAYRVLMNGLGTNHFAGFCRNLQFDFPRLCQVLQALDSFSGKWGRRGWFQRLGLRMEYGVKGDVVYLCQLPGIGKVRANKLYNSGIRTLADVADNPARVQAATGLKAEKINAIILEAQKLRLVGD